MTRIEESRNSQLRETETREETEYVFEEPDATHIPRRVEERFNQQEMSLGWLRILLNGQDDYQEIDEYCKERESIQKEDNQFRWHFRR